MNFFVMSCWQLIVKKNNLIFKSFTEKSNKSTINDQVTIT